MEAEHFDMQNPTAMCPPDVLWRHHHKQVKPACANNLILPAEQCLTQFSSTSLNEQ